MYKYVFMLLKRSLYRSNRDQRYDNDTLNFFPIENKEMLLRFSLTCAFFGGGGGVDYPSLFP